MDLVPIALAFPFSLPSATISFLVTFLVNDILFSKLAGLFVG